LLRIASHGKIVLVDGKWQALALLHASHGKIVLVDGKWQAPVLLHASHGKIVLVEHKDWAVRPALHKIY
jgi:hypothetical protein